MAFAACDRRHTGTAPTIGRARLSVIDPVDLIEIERMGAADRNRIAAPVDRNPL